MGLTVTKEMVLSFLLEHPVMHLAFIAEQRPHSSVVLFYIDTEFNFYFCTEETTFKAKSLLQNPTVSFSVYDEKIMLIQADGIAQELSGPEQDDIMSKIASVHNKLEDFWSPIVRIAENHYVVFKIIPNWMRVLDLTDKTIKAAQTPFTEIDLK